jgi:hypothetical protein
LRFSTGKKQPRTKKQVLPYGNRCGMSMRTFTQNEPLTDAELDRLGDFLESCKSGKAMNVEALDGFFAALIAGPETVMPSEYYGRDIGRLRVRQPRRGERNLGAHDAALERHRRDAVQGRGLRAVAVGG